MDLGGGHEASGSQPSAGHITVGAAGHDLTVMLGVGAGCTAWWSQYKISAER